MTSPFLGESPIPEHRRSLPPASDPARLSANVRLERHYRGALSVLVVTMKTITDSGKSPQLKIRADSKSIRYPRGDRYSSSACPFHGGQSPTQCSVQGKLDTLVCQILTNSNEMRGTTIADSLPADDHKFSSPSYTPASAFRKRIWPMLMVT